MQNQPQATFDWDWSIRTADTILARRPVLAEKWNYEAGVILKALEQVWRASRDPKYFEYIKKSVDHFVDEEGNIHTYRREDYNLDQVNSGKALLFLYRETGDSRYARAARLIREQLRMQPRTGEGEFWHKQIYPHQVWLDGLYMATPFYAEYAALFNEPDRFEDLAGQLFSVYHHTKDEKTGLLYHGWDESKSQSWANPVTGCSSCFWGRAMGWYTMALVDVLDYLPQTHPAREQLQENLGQIAAALIRVVDPSTGLWYQVLDQGERAGNYLEASASAMFSYAFLKGARLGYLGSDYKTRALASFEGMIRQFVRLDEQGWVHLDGICKVAGLGRYSPEQPYRDGTFSYYIGEPVVSDDYKGLGPFILAGVEKERALAGDR